MKDPCKDCENKQIDHWGYFCDLSCGLHSTYENYRAGYEQSVLDNKEWMHDGYIKGVKEVVEWVEANLTYPTRGEGICFERNLEWQAKLKSWNISA